MTRFTAKSLAADYERDGYVIVPDVLTPEDCDRLKAESRDVLQKHGKPGATVHLYVALVSPLFKALSEDPRVIELLQPIMPTGVMFLNDKIVFKAADKTFATPWHIDYFYWREARPKISVWIPLDDASAENGTLTVIPGSHKKEWKPKKGGVDGEFFNELDGSDWRPADVVVCNIRRGSAVIFSDRLVHGSTANTAKRDRFAIISTYQAPGPDEPFDLDFPARKVIVPAA